MNTADLLFPCGEARGDAPPGARSRITDAGETDVPRAASGGQVLTDETLHQHVQTFAVEHELRGVR